MIYQARIVEPVSEGMALVRLNRPKAPNALNAALLCEPTVALDEIEADDSARCVVLTDSDRAFAAGADIKAFDWGAGQC